MCGCDGSVLPSIFSNKSSGNKLRNIRHILRDWTIEEGWRQKARQNVVVLEWGARSIAALGIFGVNV